MTGRSLRLLLLGFLGACSDVPEPRWPPHADFEVTARYALDATRTIALPFSRGDLTLYHLVVQPKPLAERFEEGRRTLLFGTDVERVEVRCRGRRFARPPQELEQLFPGAQSLTQS